MNKCICIKKYMKVYQKYMKSIDGIELIIEPLEKYIYEERDIDSKKHFLLYPNKQIGTIRMNMSDFNKHFIPLEEQRDKLIDNIVNNEIYL